MTQAIVSAALEWHAAREKRLAIGGELRQFREAHGRGHEGYLAKAQTEARRLELAAARALAKAVKESQLVPTFDVVATEVKTVLTLEN